MVQSGFQVPIGGVWGTGRGRSGIRKVRQEDGPGKQDKGLVSRMEGRDEKRWDKERDVGRNIRREGMKDGI